MGAFTEPEAKGSPGAVWVLIRYASLAQVVSVTAALNQDSAVQAAGVDYLSSPTPAQPPSTASTAASCGFPGARAAGRAHAGAAASPDLRAAHL